MSAATDMEDYMAKLTCFFKI